MVKTVLVCPPTHYKVVYKINPWMDTKNPVTQARALAEFNALKRAYQKLGVTVHEIPQKEGLPDMVYAANFGFPFRLGKKNIFIPANFMHDERKKESALAEDYFKKKGFQIRRIAKDIIWEGQGDLLKAGDTYIVGWGKRSDKKAKGALAERLEVREKDMIDLRLTSGHYYHVDTALAPLDENTVVINSKAFNRTGLRKIHNRFDRVIEASDQDNSVLACNLVVVEQNKKKTIVTGKGISQALKDQYRDHGFSVREIPMNEFRKGGGSVKCLTLEYY